MRIGAYFILTWLVTDAFQPLADRRYRQAVNRHERCGISKVPTPGKVGTNFVPILKESTIGGAHRAVTPPQMLEKYDEPKKRVVFRRVAIRLTWFVSFSGIVRCGVFLAAAQRFDIATVLAGFGAKFRANWLLYSTIPIISGLLNWATNNLAVKMIFYPLEFKGIRLKTWPETPLALFGWTGIVPVKARSMSTRMVRMVTSKLIDVKAIFRRLSPEEVAALLSPAMENVIDGVASDLGASFALKSGAVRALATEYATNFTADFTRLMQSEIEQVWDLEGMVVEAMVQDKKLLVELFQQCGEQELKFVVNSGLILGGLLGIIQMAIWVLWDPWWSLAVGGAAVGYVTNFVAIKSIFAPVRPVFFGPFKIQGLFLTRQKEVSSVFSAFLSSKVLKSENIWDEILHGRRKNEFKALIENHADTFVRSQRGGAWIQSAVGAEGRLSKIITARVLTALEKDVWRLHPYVDRQLGLEAEMRTQMRKMTPEEFEGVLHPIFEEDELTLIVIGAALGLTAGFLQSLAPY